MTLVTSVRSAMATNLATVTGFQINQYVIGSPTPPTIEIDYHPDGVTYDLTMQRGYDEWWFTVRAFVAYTTDQGAQMQLDDMLAPFGATSVKAAVESDRKLGGTVADLHVTQAQPRTFQAGTNSLMLGADWTVRVLAAGH